MDIRSITVITLIYNTGNYVVQALESLRKQTYFHLVENIIVDDGSQDNSVRVVKDWISANDHDCRLICNSQNMGIPYSINQALKESGCKYYTFLCDDVWQPGYLESQVQVLEACSDQVALVFSDAEEIDQFGSIVASSFLRKRGFDTRQIGRGNVFEDILEWSYIPAISTLIRRQVLEEVGYYDERLVSEDYDMWLRITNKFDVKFNPQTLVQYRRHPSSITMSGGVAAIAKSKLLILEKHWGKSARTNNIILMKALPLIHPCYRNGDKVLALSWAKRIVSKAKPSYGFRLVHMLQRFGFPLIAINMIYRVLIRTNLITAQPTLNE